VPRPAPDLKPSGQHVTVPAEIFASLRTMLPRVPHRRPLTAVAGAMAARSIRLRAQCRLASSQVMDNSHGTAPTFRCGQCLRSELRLRQRLKPADFSVNVIEPRAPGSPRTIHFCRPAIRRQTPLFKQHGHEQLHVSPRNVGIVRL